jgi:hypothetical protein
MRVLRARCARAPLTSVTSGPGPGDHGRHCVHGAPGKAEPAAVTAITAPVVGPCPPYERDKREGSVTADPPGGHDGHGRNCPLGHRAGGPDGAGQDDSCDHGDHGDHGGHGGHGSVTVRTKRASRVTGLTATRRVLVIAEAPGGARTPHSDPGSGPPSERNRLRPAGGAPTTPPGRAGGQAGKNHDESDMPFVPGA